MNAKVTTSDGVKQKIGDEIVEALREEVFVVEGTPMATHKFKDGQFKNKPLLGGQQFFLTEARIGKKNENLIFIFEPLNELGFIIEVEPRKIDEIFPSFAPALIDAFGDAFDELEDLPNPDVVVAYLVKHRRREIKAEADHIAQLEREAVAEQNENNANWGIF